MEQQEIKKTIRIFGLASFFNDLGSDMIYPISSLFVTSVLGANMAVLGLLDGLFWQNVVSRLHCSSRAVYQFLRLFSCSLCMKRGRLLNRRVDK